MSYSNSNTSYIKVDYTYTISQWTITGVAQNSSGTFKFGSNFIVVDASGDKVEEYHSYWMS